MERKSPTRNLVAVNRSTSVVKSTQVKRAGKIQDLPKIPENKEYRVIFNNEMSEVEIKRGSKVICSAALSFDDVNCSCGIQDADGLGQYASMFKHLGVSCPNRKELIKEALLLNIHHIKDEENAAFVIVSNNNQKGNELINEICDEICISCTDYRPNPNMNNATTIRAWFI